MTVREDVALTDEQLRRWLGDLARPDRLDHPVLRTLLSAHDRLPESDNPLAIGQAAAAMLGDTIERLRPMPPAPRQQTLPYLALRSFVDGAKAAAAARELGLSPRQFTRERARGLQLLRAELEPPTTGGPAAAARRSYRGEPIPAIHNFQPRPDLLDAIAAGLATHRLVHLHGPPGVGKTSVAAEYALEWSRHAPALWYRFRRGVNDSLEAVLFELGEQLRGRGRTALAAAVDAGRPVTVATRIALRELADLPLLVVLDDHHLVDAATGVDGFVAEATGRLPLLAAIVIGRNRPGRELPGAQVEIPSLTTEETALLLARLGAAVPEELSTGIHDWTRGIPQLVSFAASWLKGATPSEIGRVTTALADEHEVQEFLLGSITELLSASDLAVLGAASVFRGRFTDYTLAHVADLPRGVVQDTVKRLVSHHVATRSRDGDVAFFHGSVRDYIYGRLDPRVRRNLHARAAEWFAADGDDEAAGYHRAEATASG